MWNKHGYMFNLYIISINVYLLLTFLSLYSSNSYMIQRKYNNLGQPLTDKKSNQKQKNPFKSCNKVVSSNKIIKQTF